MSLFLGLAACDGGGEKPAADSKAKPAATTKDAKAEAKADTKAEAKADAKEAPAADAKEAAAEGGDKPEEAAAEGGDKPEEAAAEGGDKPEEAAAEGGDKPEEAAAAEPKGDEPKADKPKPKGDKPKPKGDDKPKPEPAAAASNVDAKGLYMKKCKTCHGATGAADTKIAKKNDIPSWKEAGWKGKWSHSKIKDIVTNGKSGTKMKAFKSKLSAEEIEAVSKYARGLGK